MDKRQAQLKHDKPHVFDKVQEHGMRIVRLEYSYACNFHCQHCSIRDLQKKQNRMSLLPVDVANLAKQADKLGFGQFVISGGEPLIYPDFDDVVKAINPDKFWITTDSNGWYLDQAKAEHLKNIGVDKVQISIDNLIPHEHDAFRNKPGSWGRAIKAVEHCKNAGLNVLIQTVVDKQRVHSKELIDFILYFNVLKVPVYIGYAKPVGAWKDKGELIDTEDIEYIESLTKNHNVFTHLTPSYDYPGGCIAVKRMVNITKWGDVNPCPFMQEISLGNVFDEPLADIIERGMSKYGEHIPTCLMATDRDYIEKWSL